MKKITPLVRYTEVYPMPGFKLAIFDGLCKNFLLGTSNCLFCAIEIVGKKYDISLETMENLSHAFLISTAENTRKSLIG